MLATCPVVLTVFTDAVGLPMFWLASGSKVEAVTHSIPIVLTHINRVELLFFGLGRDMECEATPVLNP